MYLLTIKDTVANIFYSICQGISYVINYIFSYLPENPFNDISVPSEVASVLGHLNYFLPIKQFIVVLGLWLGAMILIT